MTLVRIAGLDGSLRNFGVAIMSLDTETMDLRVEDLHLIKTDTTKAKSVRKSSDSFDRASILRDAVQPLLAGCAATFAEIPSGGKSYSAVLGFGIVIGTYAGLSPRPIEVSPAETKIAATGEKDASKEMIMEWAEATYPNAPWRRVKRNGAMVFTQDNEHIADAVAICHAGIKTPLFKQVISILRGNIVTAA